MTAGRTTRVPYALRIEKVERKTGSEPAFLITTNAGSFDLQLGICYELSTDSKDQKRRAVTQAVAVEIVEKSGNWWITYDRTYVGKGTALATSSLKTFLKTYDVSFTKKKRSVHFDVRQTTGHRYMKVRDVLLTMASRLDDMQAEIDRLTKKLDESVPPMREYMHVMSQNIERIHLDVSAINIKVDELHEHPSVQHLRQA
mgnify:CR=1 FL=1